MDSYSDDSLASPTKARQAAIQAKDWAYVNSWLIQHYAPKSVPPFERNEDTLRVLLGLAAANDAADEEAALQHHAKKEILDSLQARKVIDAKNAHDRQKEEILDELELCLDEASRSNLEDLAGVAVNLGHTSNPTLQGLGQSIVELTAEEFDAQNQLAKVEELHQYLRKELERLQHDLEGLKSSPSYEAPAETQSLTSEWVRSTKILSARIGEYQDRIASLERSQPKGPTLQEVVVEEEQVVRLGNDVRSLERQVKAFHEFPTDVAGARRQYKESEQRLSQLAFQRDALLGKSVHDS
ncbi:hypothetical protein POX_a01732 [Penicillium oxalicum]|uniref:hypothetical protein n=1 Tax=Penicillium oxalicum TaxID=69781 RepID=UPI0020B71AE7|nr:hypothetical protein POX_a01732 [Penicillium oxalicum]KAI2795127.1 hypothetical protein POX_a01732 [Penicillium oxalicum]